MPVSLKRSDAQLRADGERTIYELSRVGFNVKQQVRTPRSDDRNRGWEAERRVARRLLSCHELTPLELVRLAQAARSSGVSRADTAENILIAVEKLLRKRRGGVFAEQVLGRHVKRTHKRPAVTPRTSSNRKPRNTSGSPVEPTAGVVPAIESGCPAGQPQPVRLPTQPTVQPQSRPPRLPTRPTVTAALDSRLPTRPVVTA